MKSNTKAKFKNQKGSATMVAMMGIGLLAFSVSSSVLINSQMVSSAKTARASENAASVVQSLMVMFSDSEMCLKGAKSDSAGNGSNLRFLNNNGGGNGFNDTLASSILGQRIRVRSSYVDPADPDGLFLTDGAVIQELGLRVDSLRFKLRSASGNERTGEVFITLSAVGDSQLPLRGRKVADVKVVLNGNQVESCVATDTAMSAEAICADMGCNFDPTDADGNEQLCDCPLPEITCTDIPNGYIKGMIIDSAGNVQPMCGQALFECPADFNYLEGFNFTGSKLCAQVGVAIQNGACGAANGGTYDDSVAVNTAGLCSSGGANPAIVTAASGPWAWTCDGINGGTQDTCSAQQTPPPISGSCGPAHGNSYATAAEVNAAGLCTTGITNPSTGVSGTGPWNWSCDQSGGGTTVSCLAGKASGWTGGCTLAGTDNAGWTVSSSTIDLDAAASAIGIAVCESGAAIGVYSSVGSCVFAGVAYPVLGEYDHEYDYYTCAACPAGTSNSGAGGPHPTESSCSCVNADETWNSTSNICEVAAPPSPWRPIAGGVVPPRRGHYTVWTGSRMFVWGGYSPAHGNSSATGHLFNPTDGTWTDVSNTNAPPVLPLSDNHGSRGYAVWTGSKVLIVGLVSGKYDGRLYDPATDTWTSISTVNSPIGNMSSSYPEYAWTGSKLVVSISSSMTIYDVGTNTWTSADITGRPGGRYRGLGALNANEIILFGGGTTDSSMPDWEYENLRHVWIYNIGTNTWTQKPDPAYLPEGRWQLSFSKWGSKILMMGGHTQNILTRFGGGALYDPATNTWQAVADANHSSWTSSEELVDRGTWGGNRFYAWNQYGAGDIYDAAADQWYSMDVINDPPYRNNNSIVWTGSELIIWGGGYGFTPLSDGAIYNPSLDPGVP